MSAGAAVNGALVTKLRAALPDIPVFEGVGPAAVLPRIELAEPQAADWSAVAVRGRELRTAATVRVADGQRGRLGTVCSAIEAAGEAIDGDVGGWRVVGALFVRARPVAEKNGAAVTVEHRVRVVEL